MIRNVSYIASAALPNMFRKVTDVDTIIAETSVCSSLYGCKDHHQQQQLSLQLKDVTNKFIHGWSFSAKGAI